jgi:hypothetical protein
MEQRMANTQQRDIAFLTALKALMEEYKVKEIIGDYMHGGQSVIFHEPHAHEIEFDVDIDIKEINAAIARLQNG